ncbi:hypothetical protein HELRODRAFT_62917 [Helobdella robusta]|uniref:Nucleoside diphosphate kinase homolog 5 n=1 Tax=Helobdella robusta TaxID=6412 RepID=T1FX75_HELRO|nr:hypothetical protein HELRODRAFT_62917 [Helobdella robusta]ESO12953.1 hypothetical protein HELRODRAFT_62917 [Helobdella robusta]
MKDIENEEGITIEKTLAIIKPDAFEKEYEILDTILRNGFFVLNKMKIHLSPEQASEFYEEHYNKSFFSRLIHYISSGYIIVLVLGKQNAVLDWRNLIGPTDSEKARESHPHSLRALYGKDKEVNAFHGSDSLESAKREIKFFFPNLVEEPVALENDARYFMQKYVNPTLLKGLTALCHKKPENPVVWLADWLTNNNPNKPRIQEA